MCLRLIKDTFNGIDKKVILKRW